jgi:hypothetical protein
MNTKVKVGKINEEAKEAVMKIDGDAERQPEEASKEVAGEVMTSLNEALTQVEKAYKDYKAAERQVSVLYKQNEEQVVWQYRKVERKSQITCDKNVTEALKVRQAAIAQATKAHVEAIAQTENAYEKAQEEADRVCQAVIEQAWERRDKVDEEGWKARQESLTEAWELYAKSLSSN